MIKFKMPTVRERVAILGTTGSGKTYLGAFLLSRAPFTEQPYVIIDYKGDDLLNDIPGMREIGVHERPPKKKHPGIYILHLGPENEDQMENWLWQVHRQGDIGLLADEAYSLPNQKAFRAILTQGRSLNIPAICLSQRPVDVPRFVFTEAAHICVYRLNDDRDKDTVSKFTPRNFLNWIPPGIEAVKASLPEELGGGDVRLPEFHSRWYDVARDEVFCLRPVPDADAILDYIDVRIGKRHKFI